MGSALSSELRLAQDAGSQDVSKLKSRENDVHVFYYPAKVPSLFTISPEG